MISPCVNICQIGGNGRCIGCARSLDEIARWGLMTETERQRIMADLPARRLSELPAKGTSN